MAREFQARNDRSFQLFKFFFLFLFPAPYSSCTLSATYYWELLICEQGSGKNDVTQQWANHLTTAVKNVFNTTKILVASRLSRGRFDYSVSNWRLCQKKLALHLKSNLNKQPALANMTIIWNNAGEKLKIAFQKQTPSVEIIKYTHDRRVRAGSQLSARAGTVAEHYLDSKTMLDRTTTLSLWLIFVRLDSKLIPTNLTFHTALQKASKMSPCFKTAGKLPVLQLTGNICHCCQEDF